MFLCLSMSLSLSILSLSLSLSLSAGFVARVAPGHPVTCRVLQINVERFSLELSCRGSVLRDERHEYGPNFWRWDPYFDLYVAGKCSESMMAFFYFCT